MRLRSSTAVERQSSRSRRVRLQPVLSLFARQNLGEAARKLFEDAQTMLAEVIANQSLTARAVLGFWPANTKDFDTIEIYEDDSRQQVRDEFFTLRQQSEKAPGVHNIAFSDYLAPRDWQGGPQVI